MGPMGPPGVGYRTDCAGTNVAVWNTNSSSGSARRRLRISTTAVAVLTRAS